MSGVKMFRPEQAPKDGTMFLGDFGWPWLCPACWCPMSGRWALAVMQAAGDMEDVWWETDTDEDLRGWTPLPALPREYEPVDFDT